MSSRKKTTSKLASSDGPSREAPPPAPDDVQQAVNAPPIGSKYRFPIVGIGASAGGLHAYETFFSAMPANPEVEMAFVVVQHLSPDHKSILGDLVRRYAKMEVSEAQDGTEVEPNHTYIIPPNRDIALENGRLRLYPPTEPRGQRLPIDFFFRSLANEQRERAICIVLSGTGSDGTLGVRAIKGEGGMAMAQEPSTTEHDGMPRSAIATGLVDYVLPPSEMAAQLIAYARHAFERTTDPGQAPTADGTALKRLTSLLKAQTGHDFSQYKTTTLVRRMERRMALHQILDHDTYLKYARENPAEIEGLFRDLLIGVTNFFRDPEAFKALEQKLLPRIFQAKSPHDSFRMWVCGCSTGEEAYSLAIAIQEHVEQMKHPIKIQVFTTDIDHLAIEQARAGVYPSSISADVSAERLARFFTYDADRDLYRVQKVIRDMLVFSEQDLIRDPPFSKLDLISCRNLLIYLNGDVQRKVIPLFHYALNAGGGLFLGTSETIGEFGRLFHPVDRKWKIYQREASDSETTRLALAEFVPPLKESKERHRPHAHAPIDPLSSWRHMTEQALLAHYAEAGVLVNSRGDILYILGKTGKYLEPAAGDAALNIIAMAREGMRREMTTALHKAVAHRQPSSYKSLRVKANGGHVTVDLTVRPVEVSPGASSDLYLVILEEVPAPDELTSSSGLREGVEFSNRVAELEQELKAKEDYLQTTLEEMETTNEELKSTNEEMQSVNEELQSTNEELETSKEELQSVNEELSTVNAELQDKVADLSRVNNDMNNLLSGTGVGTVFVDHSLRILRFTPAATQVINLIPTDIGRPVEHIVPNLVGYDRLVEDLRDVLDSLVPKEAEVLTKSGAWYLMRVRPYRTIENTIEGVVLTFVDISERKRAEEALRQSEERFQAIVNEAPAGVAETDLSGRFIFVNDYFSMMTGYTRAELLEKRIRDLTHVDDRARTDVVFKALAAGGPDFSVDKRYMRRDGTTVWVTDRVSGIRDSAHKVKSVVVVSLDVSDRKRMEGEAAADDVALTNELEGLSRLEGALSLSLSETNRTAVFDEVVEAAMAINQADMGMLQLRDPSGALRVVAQKNLGPAYVQFSDEEADAGGNDGLERSRVVDDVRASPLFPVGAALDAHNAAGVRALQSVPIVTDDGETVGLLSTYFRGVHTAHPRQLRLLDMLARQIADLLEPPDQVDPPTAQKEKRPRGRGRKSE